MGVIQFIKNCVSRLTATDSHVDKLAIAVNTVCSTIYIHTDRLKVFVTAGSQTDFLAADTFCTYVLTDSISIGFQTGTDSILTGFQTGTDSILTGFQTGTDSILTGFQTGTDSILTGFQTGTDSILTGFQTGTDSILTGFQTGTDSILTGFQTGTDSILTGIQTGTDSILIPILALTAIEILFCQQFFCQNNLFTVIFCKFILFEIIVVIVFDGIVFIAFAIVFVLSSAHCSVWYTCS